MTTPPDTPKPPAELFIIPPQGREVVGDAFVDAGTATRAMKDRKASTVHRYILAPSPQESHKLAEELERDRLRIDWLQSRRQPVEISRVLGATDKGKFAVRWGAQIWDGYAADTSLRGAIDLAIKESRWKTR